MPDRAGVLSVFYPLKTRFFIAYLPIVQNLRKMTKFHLVIPLKFGVNILFGFAFRIRVSKSKNGIGRNSCFKTKIHNLKREIPRLYTSLYI